MNFKDLARILRISNLLIIIATQLLCWFFLIRPLSNFTATPLFLDFPHALLLSIATALIAGAGYIINDYFDVKIDAINRPNKSLIGKDINPRTAILFHTCCNVIGLAICAYLAYQLQIKSVLLLPVACTILLWFYSTHFKRQFIIGNVIVSLLTALSILILLTYEPAAWPLIKQPFLENAQGQIRLNPTWILMTYSGFAFLLNWIREIIKDLEDFKGDAEDGCITMPIKIGIQKTVWFVQGLLVLSIIALAFAVYELFLKSWIIPGIYMLAALILPLVYTLVKIHTSVRQEHFAKYSKMLKFIMIFGILTLVIFYFYQLAL
ncbi:MAG: hypothetical protein BGO31_01015 [Bacteroidetes bacterium 43-16]|nr:MAG: hypothetical protein BGO31_01015 [Bacteroidetes bacterium 43-16]